GAGRCPGVRRNRGTRSHRPHGQSSIARVRWTSSRAGTDFEGGAAVDRSMIRRTLALAFPILFLGLAPPFARAEVKQTTMVRVHAQTMISCPASAIRREISDGSHLGRWMSEWNQPRNRGVHVTSVGTVLDFVDQWNNRGS